MQLSILNLVPVRQDQTHQDAMTAMVTLAQFAEKIGIERYWIAEHHNTKKSCQFGYCPVDSAYFGTYPNAESRLWRCHAAQSRPYVVAETFGTLETLYPNRVEMGLGRAPGTDMRTAQALRRGRQSFDFATEIAELRGYFDNTNPVSAYPAAGLNMPFYILGSSTESAYLAAELGLPYAFASHFAPRMLEMAVQIYRANFKPSKYLAEPYVIVGVNAIVADTDDEAKMLATTQTQFFLNVVTHAQQAMQPPMANVEDVWKNHTRTSQKPHFGPVDLDALPIYSQERAVVEQMTACSLIGSPQSVAYQLQSLRDKVQFDEIMAVSYIFDEEKQLKSYQLLKEMVDKQ